MSSKLMIAGMLLTAATPAMANVDVPASCETAAEIAVQAIDMTSMGVPGSVTLKPDSATYPLTGGKYLGDCKDPSINMPYAWCKAAGGIPSVYEVEVSKSNGRDSIVPFADVVVTFNRGGCSVDSVTRK